MISVAIIARGPCWMVRKRTQATPSRPSAAKRAVPRSPDRVARRRRIVSMKVFPLPPYTNRRGPSVGPLLVVIESLRAEVELLHPLEAEVRVGAAGLTAGRVALSHAAGVLLL